jgi:RecG-like helicase
VKEEKILLMALESEDPKQISNGIVQILNDCIITRGVKVQNLATFDIEYLFLNVRAKSVGETVEVNITCPDDDETTVTMEIEIDSIKVQKNKNHKNIIKLDDTYSMKLKYPSFDQFIDTNFEVGGEVSDVNQSLNMITSCIDMVYDKEESWSASDCSKKELTDFVDQLNSKQFKQIESFFTTMPKLSHTISVKNPETGVESEVVLEGLASFFS